MDFKAYKMDGLGNDFVIIDQRDSDFELNKSQIKSICDRKKIGCDQLILVKKSEKVDAYLIFKNSDGSDSAACGNGTRCVASLLSKENAKSEITFETESGILKSKILTPLNKFWFKFGIFLGKIISPVIMGIIFFLVVTPIGLIMRLLRKDVLNLKYNKNKSYWIEKTDQKSKMKNQF